MSRPSRGDSARGLQGRLAGLSRTLGRQGLWKGLVGGDRRWLVIWVAVTLLRRLGRRQEEVVYAESLGTGQRLVVSHEPAPPTRRQARRQRKRARRSARRPEGVRDGA